MSLLLAQLKKRRLSLGLKQYDMLLRVGISRQQYQQLESKGNPRLDTLELLAKGLKCQLMLIPQEKLSAVTALLASDTPVATQAEHTATQHPASPLLSENRLANDPWQGLLGDEE